MNTNPARSSFMFLGDFWSRDQLEALQREWRRAVESHPGNWTVPVLAAT